MQFENVTALAEANIYFEGKVVSHTIITASGDKKTLGVILPGSFHFGTAAAERMDVTAGSCLVTLDGESETRGYEKGSYFEIPANSGFSIEVAERCDYVCSYLA
ncbi:pyrimidine/purine nucleoside phosphorylase [Pelagicoccus albus]|uniref:Pyrimidine/purine nucleoside phosphorylase n=1 Tax=Pelagicoccus albus TaxID=415222 RepID=A0A7X1B6W7_9BACT|nr:pyrimidine/purine nucleoside phosphorylase [Pelagicoccus albus]MBC2606751.1 pyrimidine/purine nucleoside phosphorylase [Pelagicoccus albus]